MLFLAGGIAFNIILAAVPFVLLSIWAATYFFRAVDPDLNSTTTIVGAIDRLLPAHDETGSPIHKVITDMLTVKSSLGIYSAIGFVWFSTRLFGSLRTVLAEIFDIENERGIIEGKIFDVKITVLASGLFILSITVTTYITAATTSGLGLLASLGLRHDVMSGVEYWLGRALAFAILLLMFFSLYKFLPVRRVRTKTAWVAAIFTGVMFELARFAFDYYLRTFNPGSFYSSALTAIVGIVVWFYYAALIFILGGEVGQVYDLRRTRKRQREVFT